MPSPPVFWRSPRLKLTLPTDEIEIPAPPSDPSASSGLSSILNVLLPGVFTAGAMVIVGLTMGNTNLLLFSIPMIAASAVASVVMHLMRKRKNAQKSEERTRKYHELLKGYEDQLRRLRRAQQKLLHHNAPSAKECLERVTELERNLWARAPEDDDFLEIRLGLGERMSTVKVKTPRQDNPLEPDPLISSAQALAERFARVPAVPITLSLREVGVAGLAGPRRVVLDTARSLVLQLATHHSPDEVKIVALYPAAEERHWSWLRWLPHTWSNGREQRFLATDKESAHHLLLALDEFLDQRQNQVREMRSSEPVTFSPYLVLLLADPFLVENEPFIQRLQGEGPRLGAFPIFIRSRVKALPKRCQGSVRVSNKELESLLILNQPPMRTERFAPDTASPELASQFARAMAPIRLRRATAKEIPGSVPLLDLMKVRDVTGLDVATRWEASKSIRRCLAAPIGLRAGAEPLILDLHERKHGPNGLVAGMVGAGKSELLQTLVASLAINYHPHKVAFAVVDYKGGGMADPFEPLPHTLGVITNLQKTHLAIRALTSFRVELDRRLRLFREAGVNHIDDYQKLYYRGQVEEPLPNLVIIVDEFAEMKTEQPDIAKEFVKIARLGRAPGLCLILAMQKPAGIVDGQIEGNTRFHLCLRVASTEDSQAMLKRKEAAYLTGIGRAYLQVGANEFFEEFQVAWSGAPYDPEGVLDSDPLGITEIALDGSRQSLYQPSREGVTSEDTETTQLTAVVAHLQKVAEEQGIKELPRLWLPPLPQQIDLQEIRPAEEGWNGAGWEKNELWLAPIVGLLDDPRNQRQEPLRVNLGKEGHLLVYSAPGYGKTTFVQTLVTSLALSYSPQDVNIYIMDFGGRLLKMFEPLPHVGGVVVADESERVERLLTYLLQALDDRRERFGEAGVGTLRAYRDATGECLPAIVVILDNYANFRSDYEDSEETIIQLAREGGSLGIHLVLSSSDTATIRFRITSNVTMAVALHMVERGDYAAIVGRTEGLLPAPEPGRGLVKGIPPLEFQTALPAVGSTDSERATALRQLINQMADVWDGSTARPIRVLPDVVTLSDLMTHGDGWDLQGDDVAVAFAVPLGLRVSDLQPLVIDLDTGPNFLISGSMRSGKTSLLQTWLLALAERFPPRLLYIYLLDSQRAGLSRLELLPHVQAYTRGPQQADKALGEVYDLLQSRQRALDEIRRQDQDSSAQMATVQYPRLIVAVDDAFDPFDDGTSENGKAQLTAIIRQGRGLGVHVLLAGSVDDLGSGWTEPIKTLKSAKTGVLIGSGVDEIFNMRLPYDRNRILPHGEAYWVQQGQARKAKLATVHEGDLELNEWVRLLAQRHAKAEALGTAALETSQSQGETETSEVV